MNDPIDINISVFNFINRFLINVYFCVNLLHAYKPFNKIFAKKHVAYISNSMLIQQQCSCLKISRHDGKNQSI